MGDLDRLYGLDTLPAIEDRLDGDASLRFHSGRCKIDESAGAATRAASRARGMLAASLRRSARRTRCVEPGRQPVVEDRQRQRALGEHGDDLWSPARPTPSPLAPPALP